MQAKFEEQERHKKVKELGMPTFFAALVEGVETIRETHPDVESYGLQKVLKLIEVNKKIKKREYLDDHILMKALFSMIHGDPKKAEKTREDYNKIIDDYQK